eukprot:1194223-Prorocentrum_minimum.AAC.2
MSGKYTGYRSSIHTLLAYVGKLSRTVTLHADFIHVSVVFIIRQGRSTWHGGTIVEVKWGDNVDTSSLHQKGFVEYGRRTRVLAHQ